MMMLAIFSTQLSHWIHTLIYFNFLDLLILSFKFMEFDFKKMIEVKKIMGFEDFQTSQIFHVIQNEIVKETGGCFIREKSFIIDFDELCQCKIFQNGIFI